MPNTIPRAVSAATSRKGLMLAESRRAHLVELYKSGRWKRYFSERDFLARMRDAVHEVELWRAAAALWEDPSAGLGSAAASETPERAAPDRTPAPEIRIADPAGLAPADDPGASRPAGRAAPEVAARGQDQVAGSCGSLS